MREVPEVLVQRTPNGEGLDLPAYVTEGSAGMDLKAALPGGNVLVLPGVRVKVPCGIRLAIPEGYEGQIRSRSGLALNYGIVVLNSPGTVDSDYRGEVCVILANLGTQAFVIQRGDRIAQLVISPVVKPKLTETAELPESDRGSEGFGSSGLQEIQKKNKP